MAVHADVGRDPRDSPDRDPAFPSRITGVGGEEAGRHPAAPELTALFSPEFRRTTIVTTIMMAAVSGTAFGAIQQMPRVVPGLEQVRTLDRIAQEQTISGVQTFQEMGGLAGRVALAYLAAIIIRRRRLLHVFHGRCRHYRRGW